RDPSVELWIGARLRLDGAFAVGGRQTPPPVGGLTTPVRIVGARRPLAQLPFLDVQAELLVCGTHPQHAHPRSWDRREDAHPQVAPDTRPVLERDEDVVVDLGRRPPSVDLGVDGPGWAEQHDRLIDQVAPQVEQEAAGLLPVPPFTPRLRADPRTPPLES